jgi:hypothetical protein
MEQERVLTANTLQPQLYLKQYRFSRTERFVVRPANTTHVLIAEMSNGQAYVCIEDLNEAKWSIRKESSQGFPSRGQAEAFAAGLHRAETKRQKEAAAPPKEEKAGPGRILPVCRVCHSNPHKTECSVGNAINGA